MKTRQELELASIDDIVANLRLLLRELRQMGQKMWGAFIVSRADASNIIYLAQLEEARFTMPDFEEAERAVAQFLIWVTWIEQSPDVALDQRTLAQMGRRTERLLRLLRSAPPHLLDQGIRAIREGVPMNYTDHMFYQTDRVVGLLRDVTLVTPRLYELRDAIDRYDPRHFDEDVFEQLSRDVTELEQVMRDNLLDISHRPDLTAPFSGYQRALDIVQELQLLFVRMRREDYGSLADAIALMQSRAGYVRPTRKLGAESLTSGGSVFIGHGRSLLYLKVEKYIRDDLGLTPDSFESESRTGHQIVAVLTQMLEKAEFAIIVLTAEDETGDGRKRARQNVIHETGLFQGRLGFEKVALLRQEGTEEFSNLAGIQEIRFPGDHIEYTFDSLRRMLAREGLIAR